MFLVESIFQMVRKTRNAGLRVSAENLLAFFLFHQFKIHLLIMSVKKNKK